MKRIIVCLMLPCIIILVAACNNSHQKENVSKYNYVGEKSFSDISFVRDSIYMEGVDPLGVYSREGGIVPNQESAIGIAEIVLFNIYGEEKIVKQRPYNISLINNSYWQIDGNLKEGYEGGCFHISIDKRDGRILSIFHEK